MAGKTAKPIKLKKVEFVLDAPEAKAIFLAGTFNDWSVEKHPMKKSHEQRWEKTLTLAPGSYEYKFFVDGRWTEDPQNERRCTNIFGTLNSIVKVSG